MYSFLFLIWLSESARCFGKHVFFRMQNLSDRIAPTDPLFLQVMRAFRNGRTAAQIKADRELLRKARETLGSNNCQMGPGISMRFLDGSWGIPIYSHLLAGQLSPRLL